MSFTLSNLKPAKGSVKKSKRIGRGQGSGHGGTSTRGMNGANSRRGTSIKIGFEGGQMPIQRRIPKRGFNNFNFRIEYTVINLGKLQHYIDKYKLSEITPENLYELKITAKNEKIKILGNGELKSKVNIKVHAASETAKKGIETAGGVLTII